MAFRLNYIGIVVADMARSLAFYRRLGLDIPADQDASPHVDIVLPGGMRIAWDTVETIRSFDSEWQPASGGVRMALGLECESPTEVDKLHDELVGAGYDSYKAPWDAFWGQRYAVIHDPDGNGIDLYASLS